MISSGKYRGRSTGAGKTVSKKRAMLAVLAAFCAALLTATAFGSAFICYAVSYDGESIGQVRSRAELTEAVKTAEAMAGEILGRDCDISADIAVTADLGKAGSPEELVSTLLENVDGIELLYAITVNSVPVGALSSQKELDDILAGIMERYTTEHTASVGFLQNVSVEQMLVSAELERDPEKIAWLLSPENTQSDYSLTVVSSEMTEAVETVAYTTEYEYDDEKYSDEVCVVREGVPGERSVSYLTRLENGQEVSTITAQSYIISRPVAEKVVVGAIPGSRTDSTGTYIMPTEGVLTSDYGYRTVSVGSSYHRGIDIAAAKGTPICAADGGTVIFACNWAGSGYGNIVKIQHDNGDVTYYAHMCEIYVTEGDKVAQGDVIGGMGATGNVSGVHLHFELRPGGGEPVDPMKYITE